MRKIYRNICISLVVLLAIAGTVTTIGVGSKSVEDANTQDINKDVAYGVNLVKNGGFETVNPNNPSRPLYWITYRTGSTGQFKYPETGRVGGKSVGIQYTARENDRITDWVQTINNIDTTKLYRLTGWMKTSSVSEYGGAYINIDWKDVNGKYIGTSSIVRKIGTSGWILYEGTFKPMPGTSSATIILGMSDSSGKAWFDDIAFRTATCY